MSKTPRPVVAAAIGLGLAVAGPVASAAERFPTLTPQQMTPAQRQVAEAIVAGPRKGLGGPFNAWLRSPELADRLQKVGEHLRYHSSVPPRLNEFAILLTARAWDAGYEWYAHYPLALKAGLPASVADDLKANIRPRNMAPDEDVVYDVCMTMSTKHEISDELFYRAKALLGEQQLVDLVAISGTYVTAAMLLSLGEESSPADKPLPFPEKGR